MSGLRRISDDEGRMTTICVVSASYCARIKVDDIEMIEKDGRKLNIYTAEKGYHIYESMSTMARKLAEYDFYRAISSIIVNFAKVTEVDDTYVYFESGRSVMLGFNNISKCKQAYRRYLMQYPPFVEQEVKVAVAEDDSGKADRDNAE